MKRYHYYKRPPWIENGEVVGTVSGIGMQRLSMLYRPTHAQTRKMLRAVRTHFGASLSALGVIFGTSRTLPRMWLNGSRNPSGPATRAIHLLYLAALHPEALDDPDALTMWLRPGIEGKITSEEFLKRILKRYKGRRKGRRERCKTTGGGSKGQKEAANSIIASPPTEQTSNQKPLQPIVK